MDIGEPQLDPEVLRRARRRGRLVVIGIVLIALFVPALTISVLEPAAARQSPLVVLAASAALAGLMALVFWAAIAMLRRRGLAAVSPLWGVDRATRRRVVRALQRQTELAGEDRTLALVEARRIRAIMWSAAILMVVGNVVLIAAIALMLILGTNLGELALPLIQLAFACALVAYAIVLQRRAKAYLRRFGSPADE